MESVVCRERNVNPNIARFKDSDLHACVCLQQYRIDLGIHTAKDRFPLAVASYEWNPSDFTYLENISHTAALEKLLSPAFRYASKSFTVLDFKSTLIPGKIYEPEFAAGYMRDIFHLNRKEYMMEERQTETDAVVLTAFNPNYMSAARKLFPGKDGSAAGFNSVYGRLIQETFRMAKLYKRFANHALLHVRKNEFDLVLVNDGGLLFINTFPCPDFDNLLYYFLYATGKQKLDLGSTALYLCGDASSLNLLPALEQQVYSATYLPAPAQARFPAEIAYDKYFCCL